MIDEEFAKLSFTLSPFSAKHHTTGSRLTLTADDLRRKEFTSTLAEAEEFVSRDLTALHSSRVNIQFCRNHAGDGGADRFVEC